MRSSLTTLTAAIVAVALAVTGCDSTTSNLSNGPVGEPDFRLKTNDFETKTDSAATGCVVGAAAVGLSCLLIADSDKRAICLAGAAVGCAAGVGANYLLDNLRKSYHTREGQLNGLITDMEVGNAKAQAMADSAAKVYAEDQKKLAALQKQIKAKSADKNELKDTLARYNGNIALLEQNLKTHEQRLADFTQVRDTLVNEGNGKVTAAEKKKIKEADAQIAALKADITEIKTIYDNYVRDRDVLNIAYSNADSASKV